MGEAEKTRGIGATHTYCNMCHVALMAYNGILCTAYCTAYTGVLRTAHSIQGHTNTRLHNFIALYNILHNIHAKLQTYHRVLHHAQHKRLTSRVTGGRVLARSSC